MQFKRVSCPETGRLELIGYDDTPFGAVIDACSRFASPCAPVCPRTCAARLDEARSVLESDPLIYGSLEVGDDTCAAIDLVEGERSLQMRRT